MLSLAFNTLLCFGSIFGLENLALHQPTWVQYPWPDKRRDFGSENAVDGMYSDRGTGGQCTISADGKYTATWRVDLGRVVSISHIDIYYRKDFQQRMAGFSVYVSNTTSKDDGYLCYHDESTKQNMLSEEQRINCTLLGRYVIYYNERRPGVHYPTFYSEYAFIELCEVEVYGCNGTYGDDCIYPCATNCQERRCDTNTGHCLSCVPGYKGPLCNQVRATITQPCSCTESSKSIIIVTVLISVMSVVTGSLINFVIWRRNAAKFFRMSQGHMPQSTNKREDKDQQYTELEDVDKCKTYEEINSCSN